MNYTYFLIFIALSLLVSCENEQSITIKSQEELDSLYTNKYMKINFDSENLDLKSCDQLNFSFENVEVLKLSQTEFEALKKDLRDLKLNPKQENQDADLMVEIDGVKYCMNHLGQMYRNNRKLVDNPDLVHQIKTITKYYNSFDESDLMKKDTIIARNGVPFGYKRFKPEKNGTLLENQDLVVESKGEILKHNLILIY